MQTSKNLKLHVGERIGLLPFKKSPNGHRYAITNHGRIISYLDTPKKGIFLKIGKISNYPGISISIGQAKKSFLVHRLVAQSFLKQSSKEHKFVLHLNYNKDDNHYKNLKWATREQQGIHYRNNPIEKIGNRTLTKEKVRMIKLKLQAGKTTLKALAKKFGVSDMQIHRIKTGENWSHIKI